VVYWALIFDGFLDRFELWSNVSEHALNSVFSLFELIFARTEPLPWIHVLWLVIILALYLAVAFITHASAHWWVYTFLDDSRKGGQGRVAGYIIGILVACIIVFIIVRYLILLRQWVVEKKLGKTGQLQHRQRTYVSEDQEKGRLRNQESR
jgi:uncharacterized membrane protein